MEDAVNKEELHATITARAELDRTFARLLVEDAAEVMARNLGSLLRIIEENTSEVKALREETARGLGKFEQLILERLDRKRAELDDLQAWRREMTAWRADVEARLEARDDG